MDMQSISASMLHNVKPFTAGVLAIFAFWCTDCEACCTRFFSCTCEPATTLHSAECAHFFLAAMCRRRGGTTISRSGTLPRLGIKNMLHDSARTKHSIVKELVKRLTNRHHFGYCDVTSLVALSIVRTYLQTTKHSDNSFEDGCWSIKIENTTAVKTCGRQKGAGKRRLARLASAARSKQVMPGSFVQKQRVVVLGAGKRPSVW